MYKSLLYYLVNNTSKFLIQKLHLQTPNHERYTFPHAISIVMKYNYHLTIMINMQPSPMPDALLYTTISSILYDTANTGAM